MKSEHLIHGDLNLGNVLEYNNELTVIDWTNGQQGDPRYDIAWSVFLLQIYNGESFASFYRKSFIDLFTNSELEAFEAIACIRWILLHRSVGLSKEAETLRRVRGILQKKHLSENLL